MDIAVVTVGKLENKRGSSACGCGHTFNVINDRVVMQGTTRSFDTEVKAKIRTRVAHIAEKVRWKYRWKYR
jgi:metal-dependent amidase/aminoacylase/carboxypeptidase family protein